ncbi:MAG: hypothetical protein OXE94_11085 [Aestuariivita sp.]|nr:hypothetical protein [Aestuariivita sp.]MCY4201830.1 hypothetical protein [Aestuariivita sp.]
MTSIQSGDLRFYGPSFSRTGFTAAGISAYDDLHPPAVVRELIQNAIDAGTEAQVDKTIVRFRLDRVSRDRIPGINAYQRAFRAAIECQQDDQTGSLPGQAKIITDRIERALKCDDLDVLSVIDNGIGLDQRRMTAILSDGVSVKGRQASGAFGNGHFTVVPASDLRYILYGGITQDGTRIGSGHAHLASHLGPDRQYLCDATGVYIRKFQPAIYQNSQPYDYVFGADVPELIGTDLDYIQSTTAPGSVVLITAFNNFRMGKDTTLWDMIAPATAANFFIALVEETLEVHVEDAHPDHGDGGSVRVLNSTNLEAVLEGERDKKRAVKRGFIAGAAAFAAHRVYAKAGSAQKILTSGGVVDAYFEEPSEGRSRVDLCRNGMWITSDIPGFYGQFTDRSPFHMVLTLDANSGGELCDLIKQAEGPLHNSIVIKNLGKNDQRQCRALIGEIKDWILAHTKPIASDSYALDDFLAIDFSGEGAGGSGKSQRSYEGTPVIVVSRSSRNLTADKSEPGHSGTHGTKLGKGGPPNADRSRQRPALPALFEAVSCPVGTHRRRIRLECRKDVADAELRLIPDEAIDVTCDRPNQDPYLPVTLANVTIDGATVPHRDLRSFDQRMVGVALGHLTENQIIIIETDYSLEGDFANLPAPALRIELFNTLPKPRTTDTT